MNIKPRVNKNRRFFNTMNIAIFGGSFNPPSVAHIDIIRYLKDTLKMDKIILVPCGKRNDKPHLVYGQHRIAMLMVTVAAAFQETPQHFVMSDVNSIQTKGTIFIDDYEVKDNKKMIPTAYLLKMYHEKFPDDNIYFVLGTDNLLSIHKWEEFDKYLVHEKYIIFNRFETPFSNKELLSNSIFVDNFLTKEVSSTKIRQLISSQNLKENSHKGPNEDSFQDLLTLISKETLNYIQEHQLYI